MSPRASAELEDPACSRAPPRGGSGAHGIAVHLPLRVCLRLRVASKNLKQIAEPDGSRLAERPREQPGGPGRPARRPAGRARRLALSLMRQTGRS